MTAQRTPEEQAAVDQAAETAAFVASGGARRLTPAEKRVTWRAEAIARYLERAAQRERRR